MILSPSIVEEFELTLRLFKALARAVYARRQMVILDDVFSGMDAHTADAVVSHLLGPDGLLRKINATVIIATHNRMS
jgi:ATP-binding cassette subfamily C (CFTR/MRP) protein 1